MKRTLRLTGSVLGIVALTVLTIVIVLTVRGQQTKPQPIAQLLQSPIETPTPAAPAPIPTVAPTPIPRCDFTPSAAPSEPKQSIDRYSFSEPQVVLTHTSAIGIAGWLPDSQRILITRDVPGQARQSVETFDSKTGELLRYGERYGFPTKPIWLAAEQGVAFTDATPDKQIVLRMSRGANRPAEDVVSGLASPYVAASPDGRQLLFFPKETKERPATIDLAQARQEAFPFPLPLLSPEDLHAIGQSFGPDPYQAAWNPQGNRIAFYNDTGFYLAEWATGQVCTLDLGRVIDGTVAKRLRWAYYAQWSPNGRYVAMLTTAGDLAVSFSELTILDTVTGEVRSLQPEQFINPGQYYVSDLAWNDNSRNLATRAAVAVEDGVMYEALYLVDVISGKQTQILSQSRFTGGDWGWNLAWARNGQALIVNCPTSTEGRLCLVEITNL